MAHRAVAGPTEEQMYLDALNVCFPDWGDRAMFDWCFKRESAGLRPDLFWLWADGHSVAGTANTYRRLELPNGRTSVAAIMTGSWTLPAARGLGAFTRIIRESRDLAAARRVALLLAFTRAGNVSFGRLREAGAALFPTGYCRSTSQPPAEGTRWCESPIETVDMGRFCGREMGAVRFVYEPHEWRDQFVQRPSDITHVSSAHRWSAIVERMPQADRLLALAIEPGFASTQVWSEAVRALTARASSTGRRLFCFTTDARRTADMAELGFEVVAGFLTALIADEAALRTALALDSRVSSAQSQALADPASAWFLGRWSVQNGDRM